MKYMSIIFQIKTTEQANTVKPPIHVFISKALNIYNRWFNMFKNQYEYHSLLYLAFKSTILY